MKHTNIKTNLNYTNKNETSKKVHHTQKHVKTPKKVVPKRHSIKHHSFRSVARSVMAFGGAKLYNTNFSLDNWITGKIKVSNKHGGLNISNKPVATDAFGEIEFIDQINRPKYVKLLGDSSPELVKQLLRFKWMIEEPELILILSGTTDNLKKQHVLRKQVGAGVRQLSKQGRIWVFTDGNGSGLGKFASESIHQNHNEKSYDEKQQSEKTYSAKYSRHHSNNKPVMQPLNHMKQGYSHRKISLYPSDSRVTGAPKSQVQIHNTHAAKLIGIAKWENVKNRAKLECEINGQGNYPAKYDGCIGEKCIGEKNANGEFSLESSHTCFLLTDNVDQPVSKPPKSQKTAQKNESKFSFSGTSKTTEDPKMPTFNSFTLTLVEHMRKTRKDSELPPAAFVMFGGCKNVVYDAYTAVQQDSMPIILVAGSGGWTDLLIRIVRSYTNNLVLSQAFDIAQRVEEILTKLIQFIQKR